MFFNKTLALAEKFVSEDTSADIVHKEIPNHNDQSEAKRFLHIEVRSNEGDKVNIKIPLALGKFVLSKGKFLKNTNIHFEELDIESIIEMLESNVIGDLVDIESHDGDIVKIYVK